MTTPSKLTITPPPRDNANPPFSGDSLGGRQELARKLTTFIGRLSNGGVVAINAPWGAGKTWFGERWADLLKTEEHKVAFINAFQQDHIEDPFLLIAAELSQVIESDKKANFLKKAGAVAEAVVPAVLKTAMHAGINWALHGIEVNKAVDDVVKKIEEKSEDFAKHWIERKLENYEKEKNSLAGFREALKDAAESEGRPIVVFVDELDRCRPDFAVSLIERIKHFFDTQNVVFVLLLNREQLQRSVQGVYGNATDGEAYLSKFINFFFTFPQPKVEDFIVDRLRMLESANRPDSEDFLRGLVFWRDFAELSLRDVERACALFAYREKATYGYFIAYLAILKLKCPAIFDRLLNGDLSASVDAQDWISSLLRRGAYSDHPLMPYIDELIQFHMLIAKKNVTPGNLELRFIVNNRIRTSDYPYHLNANLRFIDLPIA
ncbi:P-loop NTPase fold protein [Paraburkholderia sp. EG285A]|uniref:KAP family P-loop NTPase fold protein n=1 Tax=Paraburkholderia sp. EG285A TaxID=3237009 RepID=UPI0034D1BF27